MQSQGIGRMLSLAYFGVTRSCGPGTRRWRRAHCPPPAYGARAGRARAMLALGHRAGRTEHLEVVRGLCCRQRLTRQLVEHHADVQRFPTPLTSTPGSCPGRSRGMPLHAVSASKTCTPSLTSRATTLLTVSVSAASGWRRSPALKRGGWVPQIETDRLAARDAHCDLGATRTSNHRWRSGRSPRLKPAARSPHRYAHLSA
jgi:hypothetical protein